MSHDLNLGQIITAPQQRDAIHIAVMPVTVAHAVHPGEFVGLVPGTQDRVALTNEPHIGIIDPFLRKSVPANARCWLFMLPNTITSVTQ